MLLSAWLAYWHYSPYLAIKKIRAVIATQNIEEFNKYVDYERVLPSIRTHIADQLNQMQAEKTSDGRPRFVIAPSMTQKQMDSGIERFRSPDAFIWFCAVALPREVQNDYIKEIDSDTLIIEWPPYAKRKDINMPSLIIGRYGYFDWKIIGFNM